jgi:hypothetical protein
MCPGCLDQLDEKAPMVTIAGAASCSLRVFLPTDAPKPLIYVFGPQDGSKYLHVQWSIVDIVLSVMDKEQSLVLSCPTIMLTQGDTMLGMCSRRLLEACLWSSWGK